MSFLYYWGLVQSFSSSSVMFLYISSRFSLTVDAGSHATLILLSRIDVGKFDDD